MLNSMRQRKRKEKQAFVSPQKYLPIAKYLLSNSCQKKNSKFIIKNLGQERFVQKIKVSITAAMVWIQIASLGS